MSINGRAKGKKAELVIAQKVREMRAEYAVGGTSFVKLGKKYGIGHTSVEHIIKRRK